MIIKLATANRAILDAEIELYREGGVEVVVPEGATNKVLVTLIEGLIETEGTPVKIDTAFLEANKELVAVVESEGETLAVDEIIFFSKADFDAAEAQKQINAEADEPIEKDLEKDEDDKEIPQPAPATKPAAAFANTDLVYSEGRGTPKTVVSVSNVIVAGRTYKDVVVASGETFRITTEEFNRDVNPRA